MRNAQLPHPSPEQLRAFLHGRLAAGQHAEVERHVAACAACCDALRAIPDDTLAGRVRQADTPLTVRSAAAPPVPGVGPLVPAGIPPELAEHPRYRIVRQLGTGGMGVVYQAEHRLLERTVALKVISRELTRDPQAVKRFRQEVKAAGRLAHPNIVTAHDADQAGELHFLVMEFVDGISLARLVERKGPLPVAQACHVIRQAALGLQHAFEQGMVHRDVKPHNLMLTRKGQVKILDFGLARFAQQPGDTPASTPRPPTAGRPITLAGMILGTPDYIAPEQAGDARSADTRSDVYSLGCTLYHLLAGWPPFCGDSSMEKVLAHLDTTPVPLGQVRDDVPPKLAAVVERMMAKDPPGRYQTPAEVAAALAPFTRPVSAPEPAPVVAVPEAPVVPAVPADLLPPAADGPATASGRARKKQPRAGSSRKAASRPPRRLVWVSGTGLLVLVVLAGVLVLHSRWPHFGAIGALPTAHGPAATAPAAAGADTQIHAGVLVRVDNCQLYARDMFGKECSGPVSKDAKITCDGRDCRLQDLPKDCQLRVTLKKENDCPVITRVEAWSR
jgi:eukaryotic-like serine/threonine-protein kinase